VTPSNHRGSIPTDKLSYLVTIGPSMLSSLTSPSWHPQRHRQPRPCVEHRVVAWGQHNTTLAGHELHRVPTPAHHALHARHLRCRSVALTFSMFGGYAIAELQVTSKSIWHSKKLMHAQQPSDVKLLKDVLTP
jgi:hypothetical protein